ncbi:hypothetical protein [Paludisphaera borealis]|nr:hypothetical protein [Paludisphaera borealis]
MDRGPGAFTCPACGTKQEWTPPNAKAKKSKCQFCGCQTPKCLLYCLYCEKPNLKDLSIRIVREIERFALISVGFATGDTDAFEEWLNLGNVKRQFREIQDNEWQYLANGRWRIWNSDVAYHLEDRIFGKDYLIPFGRLASMPQLLNVKRRNIPDRQSYGGQSDRFDSSPAQENAIRHLEDRN